MFFVRWLKKRSEPPSKRRRWLTGDPWGSDVPGIVSSPAGPGLAALDLVVDEIDDVTVRDHVLAHVGVGFIGIVLGLVGRPNFRSVVAAVLRDGVHDHTAVNVHRAVPAAAVVAGELRQDAVLREIRVLHEGEHRHTFHVLAVAVDVGHVEERGEDVDVPDREVHVRLRRARPPDPPGVLADLRGHAAVVSDIDRDHRVAVRSSSVILVDVLAVVGGLEDDRVVEETFVLQKLETSFQVLVRLERGAVVDRLRRSLAIRGLEQVRGPRVPLEVPVPARAGRLHVRLRVIGARGVEIDPRAVVAHEVERDEHALTLVLMHPLRGPHELIVRSDPVGLGVLAHLNRVEAVVAFGTHHYGIAPVHAGCPPVFREDAPDGGHVFRDLGLGVVAVHVFAHAEAAVPGRHRYGCGAGPVGIAPLLGEGDATFLAPGVEMGRPGVFELRVLHELEDGVRRGLLDHHRFRGVGFGGGFLGRGVDRVGVGSVDTGGFFGVEATDPARIAERVGVFGGTTSEEEHQRRQKRRERQVRFQGGDLLRTDVAPLV